MTAELLDRLDKVRELAQKLVMSSDQDIRRVAQEFLEIVGDDGQELLAAIKGEADHA